MKAGCKALVSTQKDSVLFKKEVAKVKTTLDNLQQNHIFLRNKVATDKQIKILNGHELKRLC
jgi:hypothetical protein